MTFIFFAIGEAFRHRYRCISIPRMYRLLPSAWGDSWGVMVARRPRAQREITKEMQDAAEAQIVEQSRRIDFYLTEYSVELLAAKMRAGDYEVPGYQRELTWEDERKSRFIESIVMGLPIPFLFFWEKPDSGKLEIFQPARSRARF